MASIGWGPVQYHPVPRPTLTQRTKLSRSRSSPTTVPECLGIDRLKSQSSPAGLLVVLNKLSKFAFRIFCFEWKMNQPAKLVANKKQQSMQSTVTSTGLLKPLVITCYN